jgi:hypothetical protein
MALSAPCTTVPMGAGARAGCACARHGAAGTLRDAVGTRRPRRAFRDAPTAPRAHVFLARAGSARARSRRARARAAQRVDFDPDVKDVRKLVAAKVAAVAARATQARASLGTLGLWGLWAPWVRSARLFGPFGLLRRVASWAMSWRLPQARLGRRSALPSRCFVVCRGRRAALLYVTTSVSAQGCRGAPRWVLWAVAPEV